MRRLLALLAAAIVSCAAALPLTVNVVGGGGGDPTTGVLPPANDVFANWSVAGLAKLGGIPTRTTVCATVTAVGGGNDAAAIKAAAAACPVGQVVMIQGHASVRMADLPLRITKGIVVRGAGTCSGTMASYPAPICQGSVEVADGLTAYSGGQCASGGCPNGGPAVFEIAPVSPGYNYSWAKCGNTGSGLATSTGQNCGALPLAADATQGQTTVPMTSTAGIVVGAWVLIDEASGAGWIPDPINAQTGFGSVWAAPDLLSPINAPATGRVLWSKAQSGGWDFGGGSPSQPGSVGCWHSYCDRPTSELHKVTAVTATSVTFDSPLTVSFRKSHAAQIYPTLYDNQSGYGSPIPFVEQAGIENLSILRAPNGAISIEFCAYCWVKDVDVGAWYGGGITLTNAARVELNNVYIHHCWNSVNSGGEYPLAVDFATTEVLITNSITAFAGKGMVARAGGAGSVVSYSVMDDTMYDGRSGIGNYWVDTVGSPGHFSGPHHVLFEGNWLVNMESDDTHGNSVFMTFFRNQGSALRTPFTDPSIGRTVDDFAGIGYTNGTTPQGPGPLRAAGPMAYNYGFAFVGNYLGTPGKTTAANGWTYQGDFTGKRIFMLGWNSGLGRGGYGVDPNSPSLTFRHGNFDTVNNAVLWDAGTPGRALPPSFYLASAPRFFSGYAWPWVNPTAASPLATLPARARFLAGSPLVQPPG